MKKSYFGGIIIVCMFYSQAFAAGTARMVAEGNKLYKEQKYNDALKMYDQALSNEPDSAVINFNAGTAQYKTNEYQKAISFFEKALLTEDKSLEARADYNLGNSKYMLGVSKENSDLQGAIRLLEGALDNYKRAIELTPKDEDAKVNREITEKKLKELKEKLKQQPQKNQSNQKQQEQNQEQTQPQEPGQEQNKGEQKQEEKREQQESQQEQPTQGQEEPPTQSEESGSASAQVDLKEMSKEEANMLLEGYRQEENAAGMLQDKRKGTEEKVLKDW